MFLMRRYLCAIWIIILSACAGTSFPHTPNTLSSATTVISNSGDAYTGGFLTSFRANSKQLRGTQNNARSFQLNSDESLKGEIGILNEFPDSKQVLITLLLNYIQSDFAV